MIAFMPSFTPVTKVNLQLLYVMQSVTSNATQTFDAVPFGTPAADRYLLVSTVGYGSTNNATTVSSMTVGGVAASSLHATTLGRQSLSFRLASVPTGTSGTIAMTFNRPVSTTAIAVYALTGLNSTTVVDTAGSTTTATFTSITDQIDTASGGVLLGIAAHTIRTAALTFTGITRDYDYLTAPLRVGFASAASLPAQTNASVSVAAASSGTGTRIYISMR